MDTISDHKDLKSYFDNKKEIWDEENLFTDEQIKRFEKIPTIVKDIHKEFPVIPSKILADNYKVQIFESEGLPPESKAAIVCKNGNTSIYLKDLEDKKRLRFTLAHELVHYIREKLQNGRHDFVFFESKDDYYLNLADNAPTQEESNTYKRLYKEEKITGYIAAALLIPKIELQRMIKDEKPIHKIADFFGVDIKCLIRRLVEIKEDKRKINFA